MTGLPRSSTRSSNRWATIIGVVVALLLFAGAMVGGALWLISATAPPQYTQRATPAATPTTDSGATFDSKAPQEPERHSYDDGPPKRPAASGQAASTGEAGSAQQDVFAKAFAEHSSGLQLQGQATVSRILPDDNDGGRHQRFIVKLPSGQTLLVAHNIDIAPRVPGLAVGDTVEFFGEYEWNAQGGVIHWTHHDPDGGHVTGWLKHGGATYQ